MPRHPLVALVTTLSLVPGCGSVDAGDPARTPPATTNASALHVPPPHGAFVELPARTLHIADRTPESTSAARLAYRWSPARDPSAPLCIVLSGGPGVTAAMLQRAFGVNGSGPELLAPVCHALFIDQRNVGFSYNLGRALVPEGFARFTLADNNPYTDAGDFLWVLLELFERYPDLATVPLVVLGESYGGVRATLLLDLLRRDDAYRSDQRPVRDDTLLSRMAAVESDLSLGLTDLSLALVLIQPVLAGTAQDTASGLLFEEPGSVVRTLAEELGVSFTSCTDPDCQPYFNALNQVEAWGRSGYEYRQPSGWLERKLSVVSELLESRAGLLELLIQDPSTIPELGADARGDAWRLRPGDGTLPDSEWASATLGPLHTEDRYFVPLHDDVFVAFSSPAALEYGIDWLDPSIGDLFLEHGRRVPVFLTRASFDLVNYSPGLFDALAAYPGVARLELDPSGSEVRPGHLVLEYDDGQVVRVRSPEYAAGHGVVGDRGEELVEDVGVWLRAVLSE